MADLSPAAQTVLDAFENASDGEYVEGVWVVNERTMLAAALRAAADQVVPERKCNTRTDRGRQRTLVRRELYAIAAELDDTTHDPLEPNDLSHLSDEEFQALAPQGFHGV